MDQQAAFLAAVRSGDDIAVERLLLDDPGLVGSRDEQGVSALMLSVYYRQRMITSLLLEQGLVLDFFEAAAIGDTWRLRHLLATDPAQAWHSSPDGFTALQIAATYGHLEAVRVLLEHGADVHGVSENRLRVQALHGAVGGKHVEVATLLLESGADVNAKQGDGYTPLDIAQAQRDIAMVSVLMRFGATEGPGTELMRT